MNPLHCPAQQYNGVDISDSEFEICIDGCSPYLHFDWKADDVTFGYADIEVFGYFFPSGARLDDDDERLNDALVTDSLVVPAFSHISRIAHLVNADDSGELKAKAADMLRDNIACCPCTATDECPALNKDSFVFALKRAVSL